MASSSVSISSTTKVDLAGYHVGPSVVKIKEALSEVLDAVHELSPAGVVEDLVISFSADNYGSLSVGTVRVELRVEASPDAIEVMTLKEAQQWPE